MRTLAFAALAVAAAATLAGCGGKKKPSSYTVAATRACLTKKHVRVTGPTDFVASTATGGALKAHLVDDAVTVAFGQTLHDADNIAAAYVHFAAKNVGISDILRQQGNAVMLWRVHPSDTDVALVQNCLR